jgi:hypothetical protein
LQPDALESGASRQRDLSTQQGETRLDARNYINRVFEPVLEKAGTEGSAGTIYGSHSRAAW